VTGARLDSGEVLGVSDAFVGMLDGDVQGAVLIDGEVLDMSEGDGIGTLEVDILGDPSDGTLLGTDEGDALVEEMDGE
jgi:hypothetical protein